MKRAALFILGLLLWFGQAGATKDGAISYTTEWTPGTTLGILMLTCDDYVSQAFLNIADSLECPITFALAGEDNDTPAHDARRALARTAWQVGADIGVHTGNPANISGSAAVASANTAQLRVMFENNIADITAVMGSTTGGPLSGAWSPQYWVYYSNLWTEAALTVGRDYFQMQRTIQNSADATPTTAYHPWMSHAQTDYIGLGASRVSNAGWDDKRGRGVPIIQAKADRMPTNLGCNGNLAPSQGGSSAEAADDTSGAGNYLDDLVKYHLVGQVMFHPSGDFSYQELRKFVSRALATPGLWITTPRKYLATPALATSALRALTDTIYTSATANSYGMGTWADPAHIQYALNENWTHPVKAKANETYDLNTLVTKAVDINPGGAISFTGPSTIVMTLDSTGAGDATDAGTAFFKCSPRASSYDDDSADDYSYPQGTWQRFRNLTFNMSGNSNYSSVASAGVWVMGKGVVFDSCAFNSQTLFAIRAYRLSSTEPAAALRVLKCSFTTHKPTNSGAIIIQGQYDSSFVALNNTFKTNSYSNYYAMINHEFAIMSTTIADTIANNIFWVAGSNATTDLLRLTTRTQASTPYYNLVWGGNMMRGTACKIRLSSSDGNGAAYATQSAILDDYLITTHPGDAAKHWAVTTDPAVYWPDTLYYGGVQLGSTYDAANTHASIGPSQQKGDIFLWPSAYASLGTSRIPHPAKLTALLTAGVLSPRDSSRSATWFTIPAPATIPDEGQVECYLSYLESLGTTAARARFGCPKIAGADLICRDYNGTNRGSLWTAAMWINSNVGAPSSTDKNTWTRFPEAVTTVEAWQAKCYLSTWKTSTYLKTTLGAIPMAGGAETTLSAADDAESYVSVGDLLTKINAADPSDAQSSSTAPTSWYRVVPAYTGNNRLQASIQLAQWEALSSGDRAKMLLGMAN